MNLIIIRPEELDGMVATLDPADERFTCIFEVLDTDDGMTVKVGILGGHIGSAKVRWKTEYFADEQGAFARVDGYPAILLGNSRAQCRRIGSRYGHKEAFTKGEYLIKGIELHLIDSSMKLPTFTPHIDLVLAAPRPKVLDRMLTTLSTLGLRKVTICLADKVEKSYLLTPKLRSAHVEARLIDGLSQACCHTQLPEVEVTLAPFEKTLDAIDPCKVRIFGHPGVDAKVRDVVAAHMTEPVLVAVGPEGGWTDDEIFALEVRGFTGVTLGPRILKTTEALISLVALIYDTT